MIKYDRLWETMKKRGISQYALYTYYGIDRSLLDRFRKNKNIEIYTLDRICTILDCNIEDIVCSGSTFAKALILQFSICIFVCISVSYSFFVLHLSLEQYGLFHSL